MMRKPISNHPVKSRRCSRLLFFESTDSRELFFRHDTFGFAIRASDSIPYATVSLDGHPVQNGVGLQRLNFGSARRALRKMLNYLVAFKNLIHVASSDHTLAAANGMSVA